MMNAKPRILLIDDEESITATLKTILEVKGYEVDVAHNGQDAVRKSKERFYNVALIDIRLPDMSGVELLTHLSQPTYPKMVKIMVTGYATQENAIEALNRGADSYILKPFEPDSLIVTVKEKLKTQTESVKMTQDKIAEFIKDRIKALESEK